MVALTALVLPPFTTFVFGEQYRESLNALKFLAPCGFAVATGVASSAWLNRRGGRLLKVIPLRTAAAMILNICLNLWLIPLMGIAGAALATSVSYYFATFAVMLVFSAQTRRNVLCLIAPL
jgi:O-antigen/teichoic acid export membrane protein